MALFHLLYISFMYHVLGSDRKDDGKYGLQITLGL